MLLRGLLQTARGEEATIENTATSPVSRPVCSSLEEGYVTSIIESFDTEHVENRVTDDYIHVSALRDICPRQYALLAQQDSPTYRRVGSNDKVVWALGRAAENHVRNSFIQGINYEGVYGAWTCRCNKDRYEGEIQRGRVCPICDTETNRYQELAFFDNDNHVVGNPDLLIKYGNSYHIVEVKSVKGGKSTNKSYEGFDDLTSPMGDHVFQAAMYHYLLKKNHIPVSDTVIVLYVSKGYSFRNSPFKEYHVDVNSPAYAESVRYGVNAARQIFSFLKYGGELPPRVLCSEVSDTRAKQCSVVGRCFVGG